MSDSHDSVHELLETAQGPDGETLELRRHKDGFEIWSGGRAIIQSAVRRSERELINVGMVPCATATTSRCCWRDSAWDACSRRCWRVRG